jgi:hypothetical protein
MINDLTGSLLYPSPLHTPTTTNNKVHHQLVRFWFGQSLVVIGRLVDRFVFLCNLYLVPNHLALPSVRLRLGTILCPSKWHQGTCVWIVFCFRGGQQKPSDVDEEDVVVIVREQKGSLSVGWLVADSPFPFIPRPSECVSSREKEEVYNHYCCHLFEHP